MDAISVAPRVFTDKILAINGMQRSLHQEPRGHGRRIERREGFMSVTRLSPGCCRLARWFWGRVWCLARIIRTSPFAWSSLHRPEAVPTRSPEKSPSGIAHLLARVIANVQRPVWIDSG